MLLAVLCVVSASVFFFSSKALSSGTSMVTGAGGGFTWNGLEDRTFHLPPTLSQSPRQDYFSGVKITAA